MNINSINNANSSFQGVKVYQVSKWPEKLLNTVKSEAANDNSTSFIHEAAKPNSRYDVRLFFETKSQEINAWLNDFNFMLKVQHKKGENKVDILSGLIKDTKIQDVLDMFSGK